MSALHLAREKVSPERPAEALDLERLLRERVGLYHPRGAGFALRVGEVRVEIERGGTGDGDGWVIHAHGPGSAGASASVPAGCGEEEFLALLDALVRRVCAQASGATARGAWTGLYL
jgi:hypothetical protein